MLISAREAVSKLHETLFVGREEGLDTLRPWLLADGPELLNVSGPIGVGKSTLLQAFRRIALLLGKPVVVARRAFAP